MAEDDKTQDPQQPPPQEDEKVTKQEEQEADDADVPAIAGDEESELHKDGGEAAESADGDTDPMKQTTMPEKEQDTGAQPAAQEEPQVEAKDERQDQEDAMDPNNASGSQQATGESPASTSAMGASDPSSLDTSKNNTHLPPPVGSSSSSMGSRTPNGVHLMYPSFPASGMGGDVQQQQGVVSPSHQLQFTYASSNFVAPAPTPIRPIHGDPRSLAHNNVAGDGDAGSNDTPDALNRVPQLPDSAMSYAVPASRMFQHQTTSPSFYNTAQDGPPVGPSGLDPNFQKAWNDGANGQAAQDATADATWTNQGTLPAPPEPLRHEANKPQGPPDRLPPPPFAANTLVAQQIDENVYGIDRAHLSELVNYAKNVSTPAQATAMAVDVLRATVNSDHVAHGWKYPYQQEEYEVLLQKGSIGLCMNMSVRMGSVTITSFRRPEGGIMGPAEASGMIRIGDELVAVDGFLVQSQEDFARVVSRLKSLRPVLLRLRRPGGAGLVSNINSDVNGYRRGLRTSMNNLDNPEQFTSGMWHMGVRYISPIQWAAELHVDGGGIRRLGVYSTEKEAAVAYNRYIHQTYGNSAIKFMNPAGNMSASAGMAPQHPGIPVSASNVRDMKPIQRPVKRAVLRAAFTNEQKEQLRAQIMVFKFTSTGGNIPNELLSRALKSTAHSHIQQNAEPKKRKTFAAHTVTKPAKKKTKKGRGKKKQYSDEDEDSDSDDNFAAAAPPKEQKPTRRSGRNAGKAKKNYVRDDDDADFELSEDEKVVKAKSKDEAPKGPQIDKIVGIRFHKETSDDDEVVMEFLIKWKGVSYLHVNWLNVNQIEQFGHHSIMRMRRYLQKNSRLVENARENVVIGEEKDFSSYFSEAYLEVDRILGMKEIEEPEEVSPYNNRGAGQDDDQQPVVRRGNKFLVKWRDLSYVDCTWEWEDQVTDDRKIAAFHRYNHPPVLQGAHPATLSDIRPEATTWAKYQESPVYNSQNTLRPYQLEGLNWMVFCWYNRRNCILADEMGLGKTVQATAILEHLRQREHIRGPFLVVAPLATLGNWKREIETWTSMNCVVYHDSEGGADIRAFIREQEFYYASDVYKKRGIYKFNVLVTSYQTLMADAEYLETIHWRYVVIDEAHKLKNREAKLLQSLSNFHWDSCLLMTGTPLQNGVFELWCLLNFIEPEKFPSQQQFYDEYGDLNTAEQVARLHEQLRPYMLRRVKEDVEKSIPPKEETIIDVELTTLQKKYYRAIFERNRSFLNMGASGTVANLVNVEMELRKCCNHPFLIRGAEEKECARLDEQQRTKILIQASGKTVLMDKLLTKFKAEGKKVLIFSQFKIMLDIIEDMCQLRGYSIERLDGSVRGNSRQAAIDRFNNPDSETFAFLLSTRAGGVGINLIAASVVILFDSDWNPQNDLQAVARCHRIGQTQSVNIYRLVTKKTYEAQMFDIASKKLGMHHAVFETGGVRNEFDGEDDDSGNMMSLMSLDREKVEMMIRYGAYAIMGEDDEQDPENRAINELDIDKLLSSSRTIRYDPTCGENVDGEDEGEDENGSKPTVSQSSALSFSKATFTAESSDSTIDFNDEQFWEKVLGPKPVQLLMTKVQEGWLSSASKEDIKGFLTELRELARAVVQERQRGGSLADADQIMSILIELKVTGPVVKGGVNVRSVASEWLDVIERPKRRRNQDVESELMYLEFLDGTKDLTQKSSSKAGRGRRKQAKANGKRRDRKTYHSEDDDDHFDEPSTPVRKTKKAQRKPVESVSGIRITLRRENSTEPFAIQKIESAQRKIQKQLPKVGPSAKTPTKAGSRRSGRKSSEGEDEHASSDSEHSEGEEKPKADVTNEEYDEEAEEEEEEEEDEEEEEEEEEDEDEDEDTPQKRRRGPPKKAPGRKKRKGAIDPQVDEEMWCRVCFSDQGFLDDPIVQCEKCAVAVHKYCYGIQDVPRGDAPWFCDSCAESSTPSSELTCALCPLKRPSCAFKKTCEGEWAHVVCALWAPGVQFTDVERMSGVKNVAEAVEEMKGPACAVCQKKDGCIKCFRGSCLTYFHPLCGRESRGDYDMFMNEGGQLRAFCPKHRSRARRMI